MEIIAFCYGMEAAWLVDIYFEHEAKHEALADRYLDSIIRGLIDWHYLENELRLAHLADCLMTPRPVELPRLRDPVRHDTEALDRLRRRRLTGLADPEPTRKRPPVQDVELPDGYAYAPGGRAGLDHLKQCLDTVRHDHIKPRRPRLMRRGPRRRRHPPPGLPRCPRPR